MCSEVIEAVKSLITCNVINHKHGCKWVCVRSVISHTVDGGRQRRVFSHFQRRKPKQNHITLNVRRIRNMWKRQLLVYVLSYFRGIHGRSDFLVFCELSLNSVNADFKSMHDLCKYNITLWLKTENWSCRAFDSVCKFTRDLLDLL